MTSIPLKLTRKKTFQQVEVFKILHPEPPAEKAVFSRKVAGPNCFLDDGEVGSPKHAEQQNHPAPSPAGQRCQPAGRWPEPRESRPNLVVQEFPHKKQGFRSPIQTTEGLLDFGQTRKKKAGQGPGPKRKLIFPVPSHRCRVHGRKGI